MTARDEYVWRVIDHVCIDCLGRILERRVVEPRRPRQSKAVAAVNGTLAGLADETPPAPAPPAPTAKAADTVTRHEWRCADCGKTWGADAGRAAGCACGIRIGSRNAGIRCIPNPARTPELLLEIIVREV